MQAYRIPLRRRDGSVVAEAQVDADRYEELAAYRWHLNNSGYAVRGERGRAVLMHRQVLGLVYRDGLECDHINRDKLDNRAANLRVVTHRGNLRNVSSRRWRADKPRTSEFIGVMWEKDRDKWRARMRVDDRVHQLGRFDGELDAAVAVERWRRIHKPDVIPDPALLRAAALLRDLGL